MKYLTDLFRRPGAQTLAERELSQAECELLSSQAVAEYAAGVVNFNQNRIRRLKKYLQDIRESAVVTTFGN